MPKTIKYTGAAARWFEVAITGKQSVWIPGQMEERSDAEAALLLATGLFTANSLPVSVATDPLLGGGMFVGPDGKSIFLKRKNVPFKLFGAIQNSAGLLGITNRVVYEIPHDWVAVRVHRENMASTAQVNCLASLGVGADAAALAGTSAVLSPVLFSGVQSHATTACTSGAGTNDAVITDTVSDWLAVPSVSRSDGGTGKLLVYQEYAPAAGNTTGNRADIASTSLAIGVTKAKAYYKSGDCVTTPANFTSPTEWTMAPAVWFEFMTADGKVVEVAAGDSITQGSDGGPMPNVGGAARLYSESRYGAVGLLLQGWASQTSEAYLANGIAKVRGIKPSLASFCPWSPNDTDKYTQAGVDRCKGNMFKWIAECQAVGAVPLLVSPAPVNAIDSTQEGFRRQVVQAVKSVCAAGLATLIDRDAVYTDYSTASGGYKAGLFATSLHPNATGYALEASIAWAPVLDRLVL